MKKISSLIGIGFLVAVGPQAFAADTSSAGIAPVLSPRGEAMGAVEADRKGVIAKLAAGVSDRDRPSYIAELEQMENHELIDLLVGQLATKSFDANDNYANMVYTALDTPCRILDTRYYTLGSNPIAGGVAREVWSFDTANQGGNEVCSAPLLGKAAMVVSLSAVAPDFPFGTFPYTGFGTLLNGAKMVAPDWQPIADAAGGYLQYMYDEPPFNDAASISWDTGTTLTSTLAVVNMTPLTFPNVVLYTSGDSHYVMDAVGYFDKPDLCPDATTYVAGSCWSDERAEDSWFQAGYDCAGTGGRLPPASLINGLVMAGDLPEETLWADGFYSDGTDFFGQATSHKLELSPLTIDLFPYRCVFTPLVAP
jgi:hypothetical protein